MEQQVSFDEFAGFGPSFGQEMESKFGSDVVSEAMKILEHPELHNPQLRVKKSAKTVSRTYDLSDPKSRKQYEDDVSKIMNCTDGSILLLDRPPKQFISDGTSYKYVAYLEWAVYSDVKPRKKKRSK